MQDAGADADWVDDAPFPQAPVYDEPPADDEPYDGVTEAIRAARNRNIADGHVAVGVWHLLRTTSPRECLSARTLVAAEIGPALRLGSGAATKLVDAVVALSTRLPVTFAALRAGTLSWYYATIMVERTGPLTDEQASAVEAAVLGAGRAGGQVPSRYTDSVRRAAPGSTPTALTPAVSRRGRT